MSTMEDEEFMFTMMHCLYRENLEAKNNSAPYRMCNPTFAPLPEIILSNSFSAYRGKQSNQFIGQRIPTFEGSTGNIHSMCIRIMWRERNIGYFPEEAYGVRLIQYDDKSKQFEVLAERKFQDAQENEYRKKFSIYFIQSFIFFYPENGKKYYIEHFIDLEACSIIDEFEKDEEEDLKIDQSELHTYVFQIRLTAITNSSEFKRVFEAGTSLTHIIANKYANQMKKIQNTITNARPEYTEQILNFAKANWEEEYKKIEKLNLSTLAVEEKKIRNFVY